MASRVALATLLVTLLLALPAVPSAAHAPGATVTSPRMQPGSPVPIVDGQCGAEYPDAEVVPISYPPLGRTALLRFKHDASYLYLCTDKLVQGNQDTEFLSLVFDPGHNGGSSAGPGDFRFDLFQNGTRRSFRGNGAGGFDPAPVLDGMWSGASNPGGEFDFHAEFRIPLSLVGFPVPGNRSGFHVRHFASAAVGAVPWPASATFSAPSTWGDLIWGALSAVPGEGRLDVAMITQGLSGPPPIPPLSEAQRQQQTPRLVAGKDTLVRAQLWGSGSRVVTGAECIVERVSDGAQVAAIPADWTAPLVGGRSSLNPGPLGIIDGSPAYNCWIPGRRLARGDVYRFAIDLSIPGRPSRQRIDLTPSLRRTVFARTRDLKVMFWTWELPRAVRAPGGRRGPGGGRPLVPVTLYRQWTLARLLGAQAELSDTQRVWPLRAGVAPASSGPAPAAPAGLRHVFTLPVTCPDFFSGCISVRALALQAMARSNDWRARTRGADVLDYAQALQFGLGSGGQAGSDSPGCPMAVSVDDTSPGAQAWAIGQELAHCYGLVARSSPNTNAAAGDPAHSKNYLIPVAPGQLAVNLLTRQDIILRGTASAFSTMFAFNFAPADGTDRDMLMETYEWNALQGALPRSVSGPRASLARARKRTRSVFEILGVVGRRSARILYSARLRGRGLATTPRARRGKNALVFTGRHGRRRGRLPFALATRATHESKKPRRRPFFLRAMIPRGSTGVRLVVGGRRVYRARFSKRQPRIRRIVTRAGRRGRRIRWRASDPDSRRLRYAVLLKRGSGRPELVASGLRRRTYLLRTGLVPATRSTRVVIEASDGFNITRRRSKRFRIRAKRPLVRIRLRSTGSGPSVGMPLSLTAAAFDLQSGLLTGQALTWTLDGKRIGVGSRLSLRLSAGRHTIGLTARGDSGLVGRSSVRITVLGDEDLDGIPDRAERIARCLSPRRSDLFRDHDGDGLPAQAEYVRGSDPCRRGV